LPMRSKSFTGSSAVLIDAFDSMTT
jgi:hypothetical protein